MSLTQSSPKSNRPSFYQISEEEFNAFNQHNLSGLTQRVYIAVAGYAFGKRTRCFPSVETIRQLLTYGDNTPPRTSIFRALKKLREIGMLERTTITTKAKTQVPAFILLLKQRFQEATKNAKRGATKAINKLVSKSTPNGSLNRHPNNKVNKKTFFKQKKPSSYLTIPSPSPFTKMERLFNDVVHHNDIYRLSSVQMIELKATINEGIEDWIEWAWEYHSGLMKQLLKVGEEAVIKEPERNMVLSSTVEI